MSFRSTFEEALHRGEKIRDQVLTEIMNSPKVHHLLQSEFLMKSLTRVLHTKEEVEKTLKTNLKGFLKNFNLPSRDELSVMARKLDRLEHEIDGIHRKILTPHSENHAPKTRPSAVPAKKSLKKQAPTSRRSSHR